MVSGLPRPRIEPTAEDAVLVEFSEHIDPENTALISAWCEQIRQRMAGWLTDLVPSYGSITVYYNPVVVDFYSVINELTAISDNPPQPSSARGRLIELP